MEFDHGPRALVQLPVIVDEIADEYHDKHSVKYGANGVSFLRFYAIFARRGAADEDEAEHHFEKGQRKENGGSDIERCLDLLESLDDFCVPLFSINQEIHGDCDRLQPNKDIDQYDAPNARFIFEQVFIIIFLCFRENNTCHKDDVAATNGTKYDRMNELQNDKDNEETVVGRSHLLFVSFYFLRQHLDKVLRLENRECLNVLRIRFFFVACEAQKLLRNRWL